MNLNMPSHHALQTTEAEVMSSSFPSTSQPPDLFDGWPILADQAPPLDSVDAFLSLGGNPAPNF